MASITPNLSLRKWDLPNDPFDYSALAGNFDKLDSHDHTSGKGLPISTAAIANSAITVDKIVDGSVSVAKQAPISFVDCVAASNKITSTVKVGFVAPKMVWAYGIITVVTPVGVGDQVLVVPAGYIPATGTEFLAVSSVQNAQTLVTANEAVYLAYPATGYAATTYMNVSSVWRIP